MLPKNKLRDRRLERLRIFADDNMGSLSRNIVRRFEDGTLPGETVTLGALSDVVDSKTTSKS